MKQHDLINELEIGIRMRFRSIISLSSIQVSDRADELLEVYSLGLTAWALGLLHVFFSGILSFSRNRIMTASQIIMFLRPRIR